MDYYFYLSKKDCFKKYQRDKRTYGFWCVAHGLGSMAIFITGIYTLFYGSPLFNSFELLLFGTIIWFLLGLFLLLIAQGFYIKMKDISKMDDLWINSKGIHLMFPVGKENRHFIKFEEIDRIVVWKHPTNPHFTRVVILLKIRFQRKIIFEPNDRIVVGDIDADKFLDAIKKATNGKMKIEYKRWGEI